MKLEITFWTKVFMALGVVVMAFPVIFGAGDRPNIRGDKLLIGRSTETLA